MLTLDPAVIPVPQLHSYLLGAVGPRPIAFASTIDKDGRPNLAPFSFFNVFSANPPIMIFSPARSGRTNATKDTYNNVKAVPEVVINVVTHKMVHQMSLTSSPYEPGVDEFVKGGFTKLKSETVLPFRVAESPIQFECKVSEVKELGDQGGAGNLIFCHITRMHIDEALLTAEKKIDQKKTDLVSRMGDNWYCRAHGSALFELDKPLTTCGIGFDQLPKDILNSKILTGNNLGQLANVTAIPDETEVNEYKLTELSDLFMHYEKNPAELERQLHLRAERLLKNNDVNGAWKSLLSFND